MFFQYRTIKANTSCSYDSSLESFYSGRHSFKCLDLSFPCLKCRQVNFLPCSIYSIKQPIEYWLSRHNMSCIFYWNEFKSKIDKRRKYNQHCGILSVRFWTYFWCSLHHKDRKVKRQRTYEWCVLHMIFRQMDGKPFKKKWDKSKTNMESSFWVWDMQFNLERGSRTEFW